MIQARRLLLRLLCWPLLSGGRAGRVGWALGLMLLLLAGCAKPPARQYRIGFSQCTNGDAWRLAMVAGMKKELSFYPEVSFRIKDAKDNSAR
ncbi:hypothetical protein EJV47_09425 [Hymenobacter gummosus]|uniref:ABC transporter substrate-binding protein n=1 Tax=Hymenobacter gummosus TaxID=1776032 RepID=A0A431U5D3_9BACT|nr:hypothetical protein [Hymenobacter gummosus]RTQ50828.1 hypothetical protein EJV47_09425 [Hymenobacter gummosus]